MSLPELPRRVIRLASLGILTCAALAVQAQPSIVAKFVPRAHTFQGVTIPYRLFIPDAYTPDRKYPVVLALHGAGERGSDNLVQLTANRMATVWADPANQAQHPCFVVAPQCPANDDWIADVLTISPQLAAANDILDSLAREFSIDTSRRYVTGLSMGGFGTWVLAATRPDRFAAAVPVSGGVVPAAASRLSGLPIWNFHGTLDPTVTVQYSRGIIDSLRGLGRSVVYTHCRNRDCTGLPDSTIAMQVASHATLFYSEFPQGGHNGAFFDQSYNYPFLVPWVFDKALQRPGAITLSTLHSYTTLTGSVPVLWTAVSPGDSVELWFSSDGGTRWQLLGGAIPNNGSWTWNTAGVADCAFGRLKIFLKDQRGVVYAHDESAFFSVNNTGLHPPFVKLFDDEFTTDRLFESDSVDLHFLLGAPGQVSLSQVLSFSADGGLTFTRLDSSAARSDSVETVRRVNIGPFANTDQAVVRIALSNGLLTSTAQSFPFFKRTLRQSGPKPDHSSGSGAGIVTVHIVNPAALTGHRYRVNFDDTSGRKKTYTVHDLDHGVEVVHGATQLDGVTEGPLFDGVRLLISDFPKAVVNADSTRWVKGKATLLVQVLAQSFQFGQQTIQAYQAPYDYRLTLFPSVVDTSAAAYDVPATPMMFQVWNLTKNRKANVLFVDADANNTISPLDEVVILETDTSGKPALSWSMQFTAPGEAILPGPGDQFDLKTLKPLTSADSYEFSSVVSSVALTQAAGSFALAQNFPNPFNPSTVIQYRIP